MRMYRLGLLIAGVVCFAAACSAGDEGQKVNENDVKQNGCRRLLGAGGVDWLKRETGSKNLNIYNDFSVEESWEVFSKYARSWRAENDKHSVPGRYQVCMARRNKEAGPGYFVLRYGGSVLPFQSVKSGGEPDASEFYKVTRINADVRLVYGKSFDGALSYDVYVKCQVKGAVEGQLEGVPIHGTMSDGLTKNHSVNDHFDYLLKSAQVVTRVYECQNHPEVPERVPQ